MSETFLSWKELKITIIQGLAITLGILFAYQWAVIGGSDEVTTQSIFLFRLVFANVVLRLVYRSVVKSMSDSLKQQKAFSNISALITSDNACAGNSMVSSISLFFQIRANNL